MLGQAYRREVADGDRQHLDRAQGLHAGRRQDLLAHPTEAGKGAGLHEHRQQRDQRGQRVAEPQEHQEVPGRHPERTANEI